MMAMDPFDQTRLNVKQARKRWFLIGLSSLILLLVVVCVAVGVHKNKNGKDDSQSLKFIQNMCTKTSYPQECVTSLASTAPRGATNPKDLAKAAIQAGEQDVKGLLAMVQSYVNSELNVTIKAALADCVENLDGAMDQLNSSLSGMNLKSLLSGSLDDMHTSLSSALTYHTTCIDGFEAIVGAISDKIHLNGEKVERILSNALALFSEFSSKVSIPSSLPVRRLLEASAADDLDDTAPEWLPSAKRRLLQANSRPAPNVIVAKDKSGKFKKIQDAVDAAPLKSNKLYVIYIKKGVYAENVILPKKAINIMFIGDGIGQTIITGSKNVQQAGTTTFNSATVAVNGNGFFAQDLTILNTAGPDKHQAVALRVSADQVVVYRCSIEAFQDTLYTHTLRQFYRDCTIVGTVDFVFGNGAVVLQNCTVLATVGNPGQQVTFTAQGRVDKKQNTGLSFIACRIDATPQLWQEISQHPSYLGRPWKLYSRTVFMQSFISEVIQPRGWLEWNGDFGLSTLFYGEYQNTGPGSVRTQRVPWSTRITDRKVAGSFTVKSFINGNSWLPNRGIPFKAGL